MRSWVVSRADTCYQETTLRSDLPLQLRVAQSHRELNLPTITDKDFANHDLREIISSFFDPPPLISNVSHFHWYGYIYIVFIVDMNNTWLCVIMVHQLYFAFLYTTLPLPIGYCNIAACFLYCKHCRASECFTSIVDEHCSNSFTFSIESHIWSLFDLIHMKSWQKVKVAQV